MEEVKEQIESLSVLMKEQTDQIEELRVKNAILVKECSRINSESILFISEVNSIPETQTQVPIPEAPLMIPDAPPLQIHSRLINPNISIKNRSNTVSHKLQPLKNNSDLATEISRKSVQLRKTSLISKRRQTKNRNSIFKSFKNNLKSIDKK